ncbi:MAG TPA: hypothetical protein VG435_15675, partial [Acidimicrobiales bacterium]|nr:hypothetical protein [Acidimicrobiales bacterium]
MAAAMVAAFVLIATPVTFILTRSSGPSLNGLTPAQIMAKSLTAATRASTFDGSLEFDQSGETTSATVYSSPSGGREVATFGPQSVTFLSLGASLYMQADAGWLTTALDASPASATRADNQWVSVPTDNTDLQQVAQQLRSTTVISDLLTMSGSITAQPASAGQIVLQGTVSDNAMNDGSGAGDVAYLTVSTKAPFYPVSFRYSDSQSGLTKMDFRRWGNQTLLEPPAHPLPFSALQFAAAPTPPTEPSESTTPAPAIVDASSQPGLAVTRSEATTVGTALWNAWVQARATRDVIALQQLDAEPQLAADWGYICEYQCRGPQLTLSSLSVTVPKQTKWPVDFMATASYTSDCTASATPCNNTFVAVQS